MTDRFVIVGGGLAAATAAEELRERGVAGEIRMLAAEPHTPYIRPPLSKDYLLGTGERAEVDVHPAEWYADHDITVDTGAPVAALGDHVVTLRTGERIPFDRLLLATGAQNIGRIVEDLRREGAFAHTCDVGLGNTNHGVDPRRTDASARHGSTGGCRR